MAAIDGKEARKVMVLRNKRTVAAGAAALLAIAGGGAAVAATSGGSPQQDSAAVVNDAAGQLGISSAELTNALKQALENRVDAEVAAGRLTQAQGDELKARIQSGDVPLIGIGPGGGRHGGPRPGLDAAASYLGLTDAQLRASLRSGKTLAEIAEANSKSVDGLVGAMVAQAKQHLAADVAAGRLTKAQQQDILSNLEQRITDLVNGTMPAPPSGSGLERGGPPAFDAEMTGGVAA
jgi:hypothetical protein